MRWIYRLKIFLVSRGRFEAAKMWASQLPGKNGMMCCSCGFPLQVQFAYFKRPHLACLPWNISVRCFHQVAQLPSENSHGFASEALFLCGCLWWRGCPNNRALHGDVETEAMQYVFSMFFPHILVKFLTEVSTVDFLLRGTPVGLLEIGGSPEPQWPNGKNNLSFQSYLHRSCLRVECHVVSVSFVSLMRNCGACPLVAPAQPVLDSGHLLSPSGAAAYEDGDR